MKIYKIISCLLIVASWCCSSHAVSVDDFVEQEFKYMVRQLDKDLTYSVEEIDITKLNLSKDETILWKRTREMEAARALKLRSLEKIMSINYMVASYPADILNPSDTNNIHLKDDTDIFDHQNMAFLCASQ